MKSLFTLFGVLISASLFAQNIHRCGTVDAVSLRNEAYPGYQKAISRTFEAAKKHAQLKDVNEPDPIYQIPVVVHIVYNTPEENISSDLVYSQLARLNKDYRRLNADTTETRSEFLPVAADAGIEFYLAGVDPDGDPTGGITRTQTSRTDFAPDLFGNGLDEVKQSALDGVDAWDTDRYLNIWVCDLMGDNALFQILGFAYPPASAPNWPANSSAPQAEFEGVVIDYHVFGENNPLATGQLSVADEGRTPVHEVGHYLGLRHIWGDGFFDGCSEDDGLDDTPNAASNAAQTCNFNNNTCVDSPVDFPDMIENYMDYADEACMNMFTQDQVDIMRSMLETARTDLVSGSVAPSAINDPVLSDEVAVFPNPSNGLFQVQLPDNYLFRSAELMDINGRLLSAQFSTNTNTIYTETALPTGVYLLRLSFEEGIANKRIVIY